MTYNIDEIERKINGWFSEKSPEPIVAVGSLSSLYFLRKLLVTNQEGIKKLVSGLDSVEDAEEEVLIRAEAVSDSIDIMLNYINDLSENCLESIPMEREEILFFIKDSVGKMEIELE